MAILSAYGPWGISILLIAGAAIGAIGGLLGIGGGVIAVPVLLELFAGFGIPPAEGTALAIGTAQAVVVLSALSAAWAHASAGTIDRGLLRDWLPAMVVGGIVGLVLAPFVPAAMALAAFALIALALGLALILGDRLRFGAAPPAAPAGWLPPGGIGLASSLLGLGAGTLSGPLLGLYGVQLRRAVGAGAVFNLAVAVPAVLDYALIGWKHGGQPSDAFGHVSVTAALLLSVPAMLAAPAAARIANRLSLPLLRGLFAACLLAIALRLAFRILVV